MEQVYLFLDSNPWISILFFAALQLWAFIPTLRKLDKFKGFFSNSENWKVEEKESGYAIHVENSSEDLTELVGEINEYLEKNEGTTDFGIIKDKVENRLESLHEDATSKIKSSISTALSKKETGYVDTPIDEKLESKLNVSQDELEEFDYDIEENVNNFTSKLVTVLIILLIIIIAVVVGTFLYQNLM
jgi:hypothetical protein